ncbi:MAG: hypothetical protein IPH12_12040 [Saprospirales bacterium]|nr:hypothetical protein [Saprospirales bacterium]MBK8921098.1 hypothetical protein [Saprospirales bacterium]
MKVSIPPIHIFLYALPLVALVLWLGLRNRPDPVWLKAGDLLRQPVQLLQDVPDSLQQLYCEWRRLPFRAGDSAALRLVSRPTLSVIEWTGFRRFFQAATRQRNLVVSGVTGAGGTKQTRHVARLLASRPENILLIECAPQFDLDYHKKYIGAETNGRFVPGELLRFWGRCHQAPGEHFVVLIDNFDKINPETFFGPALWEAMSSPGDSASVGGKNVLPPPNCHLFSVTHLGPGSQVEFNAEHFKRLGQPYILEPNARELLEYLRRKWAGSADTTRVAALADTANMQRFLFYFLKTNAVLREQHGKGYELGQGSTVRDYFLKRDLPELKRTYLSHLNALRRTRQITEANFQAMDFTVRTGGLEPNSSFLARQVQYLEDTGYLVEITMVATTALLTFLAGWWVFRRREQLIRLYGERAQQVYLGFEKQLISADAAARRLEEIKTEVDSLVMRRRLNYTEGLYFLAFVEDKVKRIEFARNVTQNFLELFNTFMEDNLLTESEYTKLLQFLQTIRHKIPEETYERFREKVERAYAANN